MDNGFNVGDNVRRKEQYRSGNWTYGDRVFTVSQISGSVFWLKDCPDVGSWNWDYFDLVKQDVAGRKDDSGKLDMTLLDDMPRALEAVVEVMQWAIEDKKPVPYVRGSWLGVEPDRYRAAIMRHRTAAAKQTLGSTAPARHQRDHETNLLHAAHEACSALMALENILRELENT